MLFMRNSKHKRLLLGIAVAVLLLGALIFAVMVATDPENNLTVRDARFIAGGIERVVAGVVENKTKDTTYGSVQVVVNLFDGAGNIIDTTSAFREELGGGEKWEFVAPVGSEEAAAFKATVYSPDNVRPKWLGKCLFTDCGE